MDARKIQVLSLLSAICATCFENALNFSSLKKLKDSLEEKVIERTNNLEKEQKKRIEEEKCYRKKLEDFINKTCHEIRNPLNGILGSITILEDTMNEKYKQNFEGVLSEKDNIALKNVGDFFLQKLESIKECAHHQR